MIMKSLIPIAIFLFMATKVYGQKQQNTTPVPILRQINRHNEDGSYSYGYEGADGQFKIETKYKNGDVKGKYGYVDDSGNLREVEYGADKNGFNPSGSDINIPPPTLSDNTYPELGPNEEDDGQYREDPSIYHRDSRYNTNSVQKPVRPAPINYNRPAPIQPAYNRQAPTESPISSPVPSQQYYQSRFQSPQQETRYQAPVQQQPRYQEPIQEPQQQPYYQPYRAPAQNYYQQQDQARNHPALSQFDLNSGSYTLNYGR